MMEAVGVCYPNRAYVRILFLCVPFSIQGDIIKMIFHVSNDVNLDSIIAKIIDEYNDFFRVKITDNMIFIHILDKNSFYRLNNGLSNFAVGLTDNNNVYICSYESIANEYNEKEYIKLLKHEIAHAFLNCYTDLNHFIPKWLCEGLSVYLSNQVENCNISINMFKLFEKNPDIRLYYDGAGIFIKYLIEQYSKDNFLQFLDLLSKIKSQNETNKCCIKIYGKSLRDILKELLKSNEVIINGKNNLINSFKSEVYKRVNECKELLEEFFEYDFSNNKVLIEGYLEELSANNNYSEMQSSLYLFNPRKSYYKLDNYFKYVTTFATKSLIIQYFKNNNLVDSWVVHGIVTYLTGGLTGMDYNEKILNLLDNSASVTIKKIGGGFLIKYIIENYPKRKLLEFFRSLKDVKTKYDIDVKFNEIYKNNLSEVLNDMLKKK